MARNAGVNLAFLGGNEFYWHIRLTRAGDGTPSAVILSRELARDPESTRSPQQATVRWRDDPLHRPESVLIGGQYTGLGVIAPMLALHPPTWTGWRDGMILSGAASGEVDAPGPFSPPRTQVLA